MLRSTLEVDDPDARQAVLALEDRGVAGEDVEPGDHHGRAAGEELLPMGFPGIATGAVTTRKLRQPLFVRM